jgi:P27 family predicted phage terminase small subunit
MNSKLTLNAPEAPETLREAGKSLWDSVQKEFHIVDSGGVELLAQCCAAADRAAELADLINREGATIYDGKGVLKENPLLRGELANRAFVTRTLARLGILAENKKATVGRPAGQRGWDWDGVRR